MRTTFDAPAIFEKLFLNEREAIGVGLYESCDDFIDDANGPQFLWLSLVSPNDLDGLIQRSMLDPSTEQHNQLAGLLVFLLRTKLPEEIQAQGLTLQKSGETFRFCISGSIALGDLQKVLYRCQDMFQSGHRM